MSPTAIDAGGSSDDKQLLRLISQYIGAQQNGILNSQFAIGEPDVVFSDVRLVTTVDRGNARVIEVRNRGGTTV